jgi:uncharacterized protein (DUF697 family)
MNLDSQVQIIDEDELKKALPDIFKRAQASDEFRQLCLESPEKAVFEVTETPEGDESIDSEAIAIVKNYCVASAAIGFIPVPLVDLVALTGLQLKMLHTLARVYDVPFKSSWGRSAIGSLVGGSTPLLASRGTISMLKTVPGIGTGLAMIAQQSLYPALQLRGNFPDI